MLCQQFYLALLGNNSLVLMAFTSRLLKYSNGGTIKPLLKP